MRITKFRIGGIANIDDIVLNLTSINSLIALNNYGKTNVLTAIDFGIKFIKASLGTKQNMMRYVPLIPVKNKIANKPFFFSIEGDIIRDDKTINQFIYEYSFEWIKNNKEAGQKIIFEKLSIKEDGNSRFSTFIDRNDNKAQYKPSTTGRCDRKLVVDKDALILDKIIHFDELYWLDVVKKIATSKVLSIDTMQNPNELFLVFNPKLNTSNYSVDVSGKFEIGFFIYSLKKLHPDYFELYKNGIRVLLPKIEDFDPVEIDFKEKSTLDNNENIPFSLPDKIYQVQLKESHTNQQISINYLSSGSKRLFYILAMAIGARINRIPLIMFEELENSIHPQLFDSLLSILTNICEDTKILMTSHSPYIMNYLNLSSIMVGVPNNDGLAHFKNIKASKHKKMNKNASDEGVSIGDYIFSMMIDATNGDEFINEIC